MRGYRIGAGLGTVALAAALAGSASAQTPRVVVNNREVYFSDQRPIQREGRVYIPLRGVLERMGAETVQWRPARGEVFVASGPREIRLWIGNERAVVDGRDVLLDVPPILVGGRTMVPLRFVGENLGATVRWEGYTRTVHISVPQDRVAGARETFPADRVENEPDQTYYDRTAPPRRERVPADVWPGDEPVRERVRDLNVAPAIRPLRPIPNETVSTRRPQITAIINDRDARGYDIETVRMRVDGVNVTRELELSEDAVTYRPASDLERGQHRVQVTARDRDGNVVTREWSFWVR